MEMLNNHQAKGGRWAYSGKNSEAFKLIGLSEHESLGCERTSMKHRAY
jgi:hypothetical protein